ncbi:MAG: carbohydrate kinase [Dysgonamonadaceae bacterium]|jgi:fructokinase|nr:carbohydrate kinase [Dysgonamonadaceae bacterium]
MNTSRKVIGIGETVLDILFQNGQPQRATPGGSVFNGIISLCRCGVPALFVGELGNDAVGQLIRSFMETNRLATDYIDFFDDGLSPLALAFPDENRNARYAFYKDFPETRVKVPFPEIRANDVLMFGSYFAVQPEVRTKVREWLQYARSQQALLYYDINFRKAHAGERQALLPHFFENFEWATLIRCSDEDLQTLFPQQSIGEIYHRYFLPAGKILIVTQGENDVLLKTPAWEKAYPVKAVRPVSTIGAGDNFNAGWVYGILKYRIPTASIGGLPEKQWDRLIHYAQRFAAEVCLSWENYVPENFIPEKRRR